VLAAAVAVALALFDLPTGQLVVLPGVTENLTKVVSVQGGTRPHSGRLMMVAVSVDTANWLQVLTAPFNPVEEMLPEVALVPTGFSFSQYVQYSQDQMAQSQADAKAAAFRVLGMRVRVEPTAVAVFDLVPHSPAAKVLRPGDRVLRVGDTPVDTLRGLQAAVESHPPGSRVRLLVARGAHRLVVTVRLARRPGAPHEGFLGAGFLALTHYQFPRRVTIATSEIGGPSAGMMFSLEIVAQLRPERAFPDHLVAAGTGTISPTGQVGVIGGVQQKVVTAYRAGARLFLCPKGNYAAAEGMRRRLGLHIRILPVTTLRQALADLHYRLPPISGHAA
jgi:PDZ domain-containing protein